MIKKRQVLRDSSDEEYSSDENHEHKTLDFLEYENDKYLKNIKHIKRNQNLKEKDEIGNLESWFKKNVKLRKEIQGKNIKSLASSYFENNTLKSFKKNTEKTYIRGPQQINIQLIQDITQRKIHQQQHPEAKQLFRATIQNFKTLKTMFDKHNMKNFEPTQEQTDHYQKDHMNTDYLNYLNDFNKKHISAVKDQFIGQIQQVDENILKIKDTLEKNVEKTLNIQTQIKSNQQKFRKINQINKQQFIQIQDDQENDKSEFQLGQMLKEKLFILEQYKNLILELKANLQQNNQVILENQQKIKGLKMEKLNIQLVLKDIIIQDYHNQMKNKESFSVVINAIWKIDQQINDSVFPLILDQKSHNFLISVAKINIQIQQSNTIKKNLQKQLENETRKKIKDSNITHRNKAFQIQEELRKIKNVTTSRDINKDKIQINKLTGNHNQYKNFIHQQYNEDYNYNYNNEKDIQQILKHQIDVQTIEDQKLEDDLIKLKQNEKLRLYHQFNNGKFCEKQKREILTYIFGHRDVEQILQSFYQMKQQGV